MPHLRHLEETMPFRTIRPNERQFRHRLASTTTRFLLALERSQTFCSLQENVSTGSHCTQIKAGVVWSAEVSDFAQIITLIRSIISQCLHHTSFNRDLPNTNRTTSYPELAQLFSFSSDLNRFVRNMLSLCLVLKRRIYAEIRTQDDSNRDQIFQDSQDTIV